MSEYHINFSKKNENSRSANTNRNRDTPTIYTNDTSMPSSQQFDDVDEERKDKASSYCVNFKDEYTNDDNNEDSGNTTNTTGRSSRSTNFDGDKFNQFKCDAEKKESIADFENISIEGDSDYISCVSDGISELDEDATITKKFHQDINERLKQDDEDDEDDNPSRNNTRLNADNKMFYSCRHLNNKDSKNINDIVKKRRCTDVFCFVLIIICWMIMIGIGIWSKINGGDPNFIIYPHDYKGNLCGYDNTTIPDYSNKKITNPRIQQKLSKQWHIVDYYSYNHFNKYNNIYNNGVCVHGCPTKTNLNPKSKNDLLCKDEKNILLSMPQCIDYYSYSNSSKNKRYRMYSNPNYLVACGGCMYQIESIQLHDTCVPIINEEILNYKIQSSIIELNNMIQEKAQNLEQDLIRESNNTYILSSDFQSITSTLESSSSTLKNYHDHYQRNNNNIIISFSIFIENFTTDLWQYKYIIMLSPAGTTFLGFFILFIMKRIGSSSKMIISIFIWIICFITPILLILFGVYCFILSSQEEDNNSNTGSNGDINNSLRITSYVLWIISFLLLCTIIYLRKSIHITVGIIITSKRIMSDLPNVIYYPLTQTFGYIIFFTIPWFIILLYLSTITIKTRLKKLNIDYDSREYYNDDKEYDNDLNCTIQISCFCFMLFIFYWTSEFIIAIGQITLSTYFSKWFFKRSKDDDDNNNNRDDHTNNDEQQSQSKQEESTNLLKSTYTTMCLHSGSAAFGALVIAPIKGFRAVFIKLYTSLLNKRNNKFVNLFFCCCKCCFCCTDRWLKYIHRSSYTQTAMFGYSFYNASKESFNIVVRSNSSTLFRVTLFTEITIIFLKLAIVTIVITSSFFFISWYLYDGSSLLVSLIYFPSLVNVLIFMTIISWYIADMFLEVLSVVISTMIQCHLVEEELYPEGSSYITYELDKFLKDIDIH